MEYTLKGIRKLYFYVLDREKLEIEYQNIDVNLVDNVSFQLFADQYDLDPQSITVSQSRAIDGRGYVWNKNIEINFNHKTIPFIVENFENKRLAFIFLDNNNNWYITGYEKGYKITKFEQANNKDRYDLSLTFNQTSPEIIKPLLKDFIEDVELAFPNINVPQSLYLTTNLNSIVLNWTNPAYTVDVISFLVKRTNPNGSITYFTIPNVNGINEYQDSNIGVTAGLYKYEIAVDSTINGGINKKYSNAASITITNFNIPQSVITNVPTNTNNIRVTWTNRNPYTIPVNSFQILRTNPALHPSGETSTFIVNSSSLTGYTDTNVGIIGGTYGYQVRVCQQTNGGLPGIYSDTINQAISNYNIPQSLSTSVSGNNITLTWTNRTYTSTVASFAINRLNPAGHPDGSSTLLFVNGNGSLTTFTDVNVGQNSGTYQYQIAIATSTGGVNRQTFTSLVSQAITTVNTPPTLELTGSYSITKYYGRYIITPQLRVIGGSGMVTIYWKNKLTGYPALDVQKSQSISCTGGTFTINISSHQYDRAFGLDYTWTVNLDTNANYSIGAGNTAISQSLPRRKASPFSTFTAVKSGSNAVLNWSQVTDTGTTTIYGYVVNRFDTNNFTQNPIAYISGNGTLTYTETSVPNGNWSYYVRANSVNGQDTSPFNSDASNIVDLVYP